MEWPELKEAFQTGVPVVCGGVTYSRISALIFRRVGTQTVTQAELSDKNGNSVTIALSNRVEKAESKVKSNAG